jgi:hypothetical protein
VPSDDGARLKDSDSIDESRKEPSEGCNDESVRSPQPRFAHGAPEHDELLAKEQVLGDQHRTRPEWAREE